MEFETKEELEKKTDEELKLILDTSWEYVKKIKTIIEYRAIK